MKTATIARHALAALAALFLFAGCASPPWGPAPPARNDEVFGQIARGMTMDQVRERLGAPDETMPFRNTRTTAWSYFYYDTWGFYSEYSITFGEGGQVVSKFSKRVGYGGGGGHSN